MLPNFSDGACKTDAAMAQRLDEYPFLDYASKHWGREVGSLTETQLELFWPRLEKFASRKGARDLASQCASPFAQGVTGRSQDYPRDVPLLVLAAGFDMPGVLRQLIAQSHPIEGAGSDGMTALMWATTFRLRENMQVLLDHGADINARNAGGMTALQVAFIGPGTDIIQVLLDASADIYLGPILGKWTPLMFAAYMGKLDTVKMLAGAGAKLAAEGPGGESAISLALGNGRVDVASFLADEGVVLPQTTAGRAAVAEALKHGLHDLVQRLTANWNHETETEKLIEQETVGVVGGSQTAAVPS